MIDNCFFTVDPPSSYLYLWLTTEPAIHIESLNEIVDNGAPLDIIGGTACGQTRVHEDLHAEEYCRQ